MKELVLFLLFVLVITFCEIVYPSPFWKVIFWIIFTPVATYFWWQDIKDITKLREEKNSKKRPFS